MYDNAQGHDSALHHTEPGVTGNGVAINIIRYADDILILCQRSSRIAINFAKTKLMIFNRDKH